MKEPLKRLHNHMVEVAKKNEPQAKLTVAEKLALRAVPIYNHQLSKPVVVASKVKGRHAADVISAMEKHGYRLDDMAARKQAFSLATGVFTGSQILTLVFHKNP